MSAKIRKGIYNKPAYFIKNGKLAQSSFRAEYVIEQVVVVWGNNLAQVKIEKRDAGILLSMPSQ